MDKFEKRVQGTPVHCFDYFIMRLARKLANDFLMIHLILRRINITVTLLHIINTNRHLSILTRNQLVAEIKHTIDVFFMLPGIKLLG